MNPERYEEVATLLGKLLPEGTSFRRTRKDPKTACSVTAGSMSSSAHCRTGFARTSDGSEICCITCALCCPLRREAGRPPGIVMIDEVDLHLHPEWQLVVLPTISRALPKLQFLCTTHSPIVAGTVESANLHLVLPDGDKASVLDPARGGSPRPDGRSDSPELALRTRFDAGARFLRGTPGGVPGRVAWRARRRGSIHGNDLPWRGCGRCR